VLASNALYGASTALLNNVLEPLGVDVSFVDICDLGAVEAKIAEQKPGCILMETISNPLLRVGEIDRIAELARANGAALVVDNTFATPLMIRPLRNGSAHRGSQRDQVFGGHGDVLGGIIVADEEHTNVLRTMSRPSGRCSGHSKPT